MVPATNAAADRYFAPLHHRSFDRLGRVDGAGWLQFATWKFFTGVKALRTRHTTLFGYGINQFHNRRAATASLHDVKIPTAPYRVAHLPARLFASSDTRHTLVVAFFLFRSFEVEAYYEYDGVAPSSISRTVRHDFSRQLSHLAHLLRQAVRQRPTATPTATASSTPPPTVTPSPSSTSTPLASATPFPTATSAPPSPAPTATATLTSTLTPSPLPTPVVLTVQAMMAQSDYRPGDAATLNVLVLFGGQPAEGAQVQASFRFPNGGKSCVTTTDAAGAASCSIIVPNNPGIQVEVDVLATLAPSVPARTMTSFMIER